MRKLIIGLLCLAALAVVIDFGTAAYSEYRVSRALRVGADLTADPDVVIYGFPFFTQALDGRYQTVDIRARIMRRDIPGEISVGATLTGAHLSMGELTDGNVRAIPVDRVEGQMRLEPTELGRLFRIPDLQVHSAPGDKSDGTGGSGGSGMTTGGQLLLTGTMPGKTPSKPGAPLGGDNVSVTADLTVDGDQVKIIATSIYRGTGDATTTAVVTDADRPKVLEQFTRTIDTNELPFGLRPTKVSAQGGQIVIEGKAENVTIDLDRLRRP